MNTKKNPESFKADDLAWHYIRELEDQNKRLQKEIGEVINGLPAKIMSHIDALREFCQYALGQYSWNNEPDGGDLQDKAEKLGLIELRPCNPDEYEGAKEAYFCKWTKKESTKGE